MATVVNTLKVTVGAIWVERHGWWDSHPVADNPRPSDYVVASAPGRDPRRYLDRLDQLLEAPEAEALLPMEDVGGHLRAGMFCLVNDDYPEGGRWARVHPDELRRLFNWWIAVVESPDYKNPDAVIDPIEIEYDLDIPDDVHPQYRPAMFNAELMTGSQKFTEARKLDDGAIFVWEPIEPWGRGFIWDPEDETWLLSPSSISHEQQIANWNNGQRTTVDDL